MQHFLKTLLMIIAIGLICFLPMQADEPTQTDDVIQDSQLSQSKEDLLNLVYDSALAKAEEGNFKDAIIDFQMALEIQDSLTGKQHSDYALILNNLSYCYFQNSQVEEAIRSKSEALEITAQISGKETLDYASSLNVLVIYFSRLGKYAEALTLGTEVLNIRERILGRNNPDYASSLNNLASLNVSLGNYTEAIRLASEALQIREQLIGKDHPEYANSLNEIAVCYLYLGNYEEALRLCTEALEIRERIFGKENNNYANSLSNLARIYDSMGNYAEAIRYGNEAVEIRERILGKDNPDYAVSLSNLASYHSSLGNYQQAILIETEVLEIRNRILGKEHPDYAISLNNLAAYNALLGNYIEAIECASIVLDSFERIYGTDNPKYATALRNLASYHSSLGHYSEAIQLATEALRIQERILGKDHPEYANTLNNLASYYSYLGNYKEAVRFGTEALNLQEMILGKDHPDYATALNNLAFIHLYLGDYKEAVRLGTEALNLRERILGKDHPDYANSLNNLASFYSGLGNYTEAVSLCTEALNIRKLIFGKEHPEYALSLNSLALCYSHLGDYEEALRLGTEALNLQERILGKDHPGYATSLNNLASYYSYLGNYKEAVRYGNEAVEIRERILGKDHPDYILSIKNLSSYHYIFGNKIETTALINEILPLFTNYLRSSFTGLTAQERTNFWNINKSFFEVDVNAYSYYINYESLISNAYNATLLSKGILLSTEMELSNILQESGDDEVTELYNELRTTHLMLNKLYEKPVAERHIDTDSLERVANAIERDLVERSKEFGDFTRNMTISWQDVQSKLKQKDLAVEFVSFPVLNDSIIYAAYVINPQMETPEMVSLFEAKDLSKIEVGNYYNSTELSKLVWNNLDPYLQDAENVYFAPTGELYNIAIEYLPYYNGEGLMSDFHNFYRLSSTRELAVTRVKNDYTQAALYGGMNFDAKESFLVKDMEKYPELKNRDFSLVKTAYSLDLRKGVNYLPGTAVEVDNIKRYLKKTFVKPLLYKGEVGTEASFKSLSGRKVNIIHLATHGFYWTEKDVRRAKDFSFLMPDNEHTPLYFEDKALARSGLLFSGANNALQGVALPEDVEDGILTAKEIAGLDLRGLDLVVLSACQTGLGEITGDGVFGLQRGFKKAGANSMLMSLWKVDDKATQMLMTKFYEEFLGGKSKHEALRSAQKYLREYQPKESKNDRPYADPKYWAAFILLDALN